MSDKSKLMLSAEELQLVSATNWILTKRKIIEDVNIFFANFAEDLKVLVMAEKKWLPHAVTSSTPKIAKGENYLQLPYLILDYPRCFDKENVFAIRTMFWWGNFFSITLHVSGEYKHALKETLLKNERLTGSQFYIGVNEDQWQHHFEENNFLALGDLTKEQQIKLQAQNDFIKLALKFDLDQWNNMPALLQEGYDKIAGILC